MPQGPDFPGMDVGESAPNAIDFAKWMPPGATIIEILSVVANNYYPAGGEPYVELIGSYQIGTWPVADGGSGCTNTAVVQEWTGLNAGTARITATIITSVNQTLIGWAHQQVGTPN